MISPFVIHVNRPASKRSTTIRGIDLWRRVRVGIVFGSPFRAPFACRWKPNPSARLWRLIIGVNLSNSPAPFQLHAYYH